MKILIPMAGAGSRFLEKGYKEHKATLPMIYRKTGEVCPMVVCAVKDLPEIEKDGENIIFIMRDFHKEDGMDEKIREWFSGSKFIIVDHLTEGQACTCLLAEEYVDMEDELLIAACDNGIEYEIEKYLKAKTKYDALIFTYRNNAKVLDNPNAYGWVDVDENNSVKRVSVKKTISDNPTQDHAIVATFWFKKGKTFLI